MLRNPWVIFNLENWIKYIPLLFSDDKFIILRLYNTVLYMYVHIWTFRSFPRLRNSTNKWVNNTSILRTILLYLNWRELKHIIYYWYNNLILLKSAYRSFHTLYHFTNYICHTIYNIYAFSVKWNKVPTEQRHKYNNYTTMLQKHTSKAKIVKCNYIGVIK